MALCRTLKTMWLKFGTRWVRYRYLGGAQIKIFYFLYIKLAPPKKNSRPKFLVLEVGYPGDPQTSAPPLPPWANPRCVHGWRKVGW